MHLRMTRFVILTLLLSIATIPLSAADQKAGERVTSVSVPWVLKKIAAQVPRRLPFLEIHSSALLKRPLIVRGVLDRPDGQRLVRHVTMPYDERMELSVDHATVLRQQAGARVVTYDHVPILGALYSSLMAIFAADQSRLEQLNTVRIEGTDGAWMLLLQPHQDIAGLQTLRLFGHQGEVACLVTQSARGVTHYTVLGAKMVGRAETMQGVNAIASLCHL